MIKTITDRISEIATKHGYEIEPIVDDASRADSCHAAYKALSERNHFVSNVDREDVARAAKAARKLASGDIVGAYEALGYQMRD